MEGTLTPRVLNCRHGQVPVGAVRVDGSTKWGNRFEIGRDGTREEVVAKHREWLLRQPALVAIVRRELRGRDLVCWCAPEACHADTLLEVANNDEGPGAHPCATEA